MIIRSALSLVYFIVLQIYNYHENSTREHLKNGFYVTKSSGVRSAHMEELINYLRRKNLKLDKDNIKILHKKKIASSDFLKLTKEKLERHEMKMALRRDL